MLYSLLSLKDIRCNGYYIETVCEGDNEYLHIISIILGKKSGLKRLPIFSFNLNYTIMNAIEIHATINQKFIYSKTIIIWYN